MGTRLLLSFLAMVLVVPVAHAESVDPSLAKTLADPARSANFVGRDVARHPGEELAFFGLLPTLTVIEISPGGGYWTEILAPYLHTQGKFYAAFDADKEGDADLANFKKKLAAAPGRFDKVVATRLGPKQTEIAPAGSADLVLTFRNLHNWMYEGYADAAMAAFYKALKPGGILGIEEHRARADKPQDPKADNGYVREDYTIALAEKAGFKLVGKSEINANPKDTTDWPKGVWTLPPTLAMGEVDRAKYVAIGEADNFVLKFQKPVK